LKKSLMRILFPSFPIEGRKSPMARRRPRDRPKVSFLKILQRCNFAISHSKRHRFLSKQIPSTCQFSYLGAKLFLIFSSSLLISQYFISSTVFILGWYLLRISALDSFR
jgi:hypothetical protein